MEGEERSGRILTCAWCSVLAVMCQDCDYGNRYCCKNCAQQGRQRSLRLAGARYQKSFEGAKKHAARQAAYEIRQREKLTHQSFPGESSPVIVEQAEQEASQPPVAQLHIPQTLLHCTSCGQQCVFVVRRWTWQHLRRRTQRRQGEKYDCCQRGRSGDFALVPC